MAGSLRIGELFRCGRSYTTLDAHLEFLLPASMFQRKAEQRLH